MARVEASSQHDAMGAMWGISNAPLYVRIDLGSVIALAAFICKIVL